MSVGDVSRCLSERMSSVTLLQRAPGNKGCALLAEMCRMGTYFIWNYPFSRQTWRFALLSSSVLPAFVPIPICFHK